MADREVKAKLTLDDGATATMERIKGGFGSLEGARKGVQGGLGFLNSSISTLVGVHLPGAVRNLTAFGGSFLTAAASGESFDASIASMISTVQGIPFDEAIDRAGRYGDELDRLSVRSGVAIDSVEGSFERLLQIQEATADGVFDARMQVSQLATIAGKMNIPLEAVSQEFGFMSEGMLKARGRLFQLMQSTGAFGDNTKEVLKGWATLTDEKRLAILTDGLTRATEVLGEAPPTFNQLTTSLKNIADISREKLGEPFVEALMPELERVISFLEENRFEVEQFAKTMAKDVGHWVSEAAETIEDGFKFIKANGAEIKEDIVAAFEFARETMAFILDHKEELAFALGARALANSDVARGLVGGTAQVVGGVARAGAAGTAVGGLQLAGMAGGAAALGAFALALGGATAAALAFKDAHDSRTFTSNEELDLEAKRSALERAISEGPSFGGGTQAELDFIARMRDEVVALGTELGENTRALGELADQAHAAQVAAHHTTREVDAAAAALASAASGGDFGAQMAAGEQLGAVFQAAAGASNLGAQRYVASLLVNSKQLQDAFLVSGVMAAGAFEQLADLVGDKAGDFADKLRQKAGLAAGKTVGDKPLIQFNGGQTFKVQQDFRDEDPDRIAVVFQKGILSSAERRLQASTSSPFG